MRRRNGKIHRYGTRDERAATAPAEPFWTIADYAAWVGVHPITAGKLLREGKGPPVIYIGGSARLPRISPAAARRYFEKGEQKVLHSARGAVAK